jgi:enamine deaminase RidA (YjgF/YER057c/UK114 family)
MSIRRMDVGPRMSQVVVHNDRIYLAGLVGEGESVAAQTSDILANADRLLARAGSDKSKLLQAVIWLTDISTFAEMNSAWEAWIDKTNPPARATVEAKLASPAHKVEIMITAAAD